MSKAKTVKEDSTINGLWLIYVETAVRKHHRIIQLNNVTIKELQETLDELIGNPDHVIVNMVRLDK